MNKSNNIKFKQILIDKDNYDALKELGKTGDSFNDVLSKLLNSISKIGDKLAKSNDYLDNNVIVINPDNKSFIVNINSGLRKVGINQILGFKDYIDIDFLNDDGVRVYYPKNLLNLSDEIEKALLNSDLRLQNYAVKRIVEYFQEYEYEIEEVVNHLM